MRNIIKEYINKITISDIVKFGDKNNITITEDEANVLLFYLKNNWEDLLYGDPNPIINKIEDKITHSEKLINLFYLYKERYKNYL